MIAMRALLLLALGCLTSIASLARPVSYAGGWTVIGESDRQSSSALVHYTPSPTMSLGLKTEVNRDSDFALSIAFIRLFWPKDGLVRITKAICTSTEVSELPPGSVTTMDLIRWRSTGV